MIAQKESFSWFIQIRLRSCSPAACICVTRVARKHRSSWPSNNGPESTNLLTVSLLIEMEGYILEAKSESSRFKIIATYGAVATSLYCCVLENYCGKHCQLPCHLYLLQRHSCCADGNETAFSCAEASGRLQKEGNLQRVLKNALGRYLNTFNRVHDRK
ncbi:hypothetical protein BC830DRAFT_715542 [Chytriomyces sp. MP71]|nr:hypothetical protein BC830DRAFT_715542 [Chytriomyces sp. MP71]